MRVKTAGARPRLSTATIVKPTGSPSWIPVPIIVKVWLLLSDVNVPELTEVDWKCLPESRSSSSTRPPSASQEAWWKLSWCRCPSSSSESPSPSPLLHSDGQAAVCEGVVHQGLKLASPTTSSPVPPGLLDAVGPVDEPHQLHWALTVPTWLPGSTSSPSPAKFVEPVVPMLFL